MKIIIAPDSFKGTLTSSEICEMLQSGLEDFSPDMKIITMPIADGGEGTLEAFRRAVPSQTFHAKSADALFNAITAPYLMTGSSDTTAVIESAKVCGFVHGSWGSRPDPGQTTTFGVGLLIRDALKQGARRIIIGLGGSCTNDGGCGMAAALGTKFYNKNGGTFIPTGGTLCDIARIDNRDTIELLGGNNGQMAGKPFDIVGMCDVTNPLCGENGASHVFGPQKGASPDDVRHMDRGLRHLVSLMDDSESVSPGLSMFPGSLSPSVVSDLPGSGAAGGLGFGIRAFAGGRLEPGVDLLLDTGKFDDLLWNADWVITGEGRFDSQTLGGKAVSGICSRAQAAGVNVIILCGTADPDAKAAAAAGGIHVLETGTIDFGMSEWSNVRNAAADNLKNSLPELKKLLMGS